MKKKQIRTVIIIVIVALLAGLAVLRLDIDPADPTPTPVPETPAPSPIPDILPEPENTPGAEPESPAPEVSPDAGETPPPAEPVETPDVDEPEITPEPVPEPTPTPTPTPTPEQVPAPETSPEPAPEVTPEPTPPEKHLCSIQIRCDTVVDTSKLENEAVIPFIPSSGVILSLYEVEFTPGESVFDILKRVCREHNIHLEFREDALYSGAYVEGINYLYEYDAGALSGWMYKVNGLFPNYGCSKYTVSDGDSIVWCYTCDLGTDVGDNSSW